MEYLFTQFFWLIFPLFGMFVAVLAIILFYKARKDNMMMIKSFLDQGKEPPEALMSQFLNSDIPKEKENNPFSGVIVFGSLAAGFAYAGYMTNQVVFNALGVGFGIAALGFLIATFFMRRPKD